MNVDKIEELIDALKSGKYEKGKLRLRDLITNRYCCLGVACDLYPHGEWIVKGSNWSYNLSKEFALSESVSLPVSVREHYGLSVEQHDLLIQLNDESETFVPVINQLKEWMITRCLA